MTNKEYYKKELSRLSKEWMQVKFTSDDWETRWLRVNDDSAEVIIEFLQDKQWKELVEFADKFLWT